MIKTCANTSRRPSVTTNRGPASRPKTQDGPYSVSFGQPRRDGECRVAYKNRYCSHCGRLYHDLTCEHMAEEERRARHFEAMEREAVATGRSVLDVWIDRLDTGHGNA